MNPVKKCLSEEEPHLRRKGVMAKFRRKKFKKTSRTKNDIILNIGSFEVYFENIYSIYSLINDLLIGLLFIAGSLFNLFDAPPVIGQSLFLIGSIALVLRPLFKMTQNTHVYKEQNKNKKSEIEKKISKEIKDEK